MLKTLMCSAALALTLTACGGGGGGGGSTAAPVPSPTLPPPMVDTKPDIFTFSDITGSETTSVVASAAITVSGIEAAAAISITGGEYSVNGGAFTDQAGTVANGDTVIVQLNSSSELNMQTDAILQIDMVSDTFSVTTKASSSRAADSEDYFQSTVTDSSPAIFNCTGGVSFCTGDLQTKLNQASVEDADGGVVRIENGSYRLNEITMPSNVRLEVEPGTTLIQNQRILFDMGKRNGTDALKENIQITSTDGIGRFTIDVTGRATGSDVRPIRIAHVSNFALGNFNLLTNYYNFPTIFMVADDNLQPGESAAGVFNATFDRNPINGLIENITADNIATGYALVQPFSGRNILMRNLEASRGVTIRLEPGNGIAPGDRLNLAGPRLGAINDIRMEDIRNNGGFAAIFLKPHAKICENNTIYGASGVNSSFVVFIDSGSAERSVNGNMPAYPNLTRAYFTGLKMEGVISHTVTDPAFEADTTFSGHYYMPRTHREAGFTTYGSLPRDVVGQRRLAPPSVPVVMAAAFSATDLGNDAPDGAAQVLNPPRLPSEPDLTQEELRKFAGRYYLDYSNATFVTSGIDFTKLGKTGTEVTAALPIMFRSHAIGGNGQATPSGYINP